MPDSRIPPIAYAILLIACLCIYGVIIDPATTFAGMDFLNLNYPRVFLSKTAIISGQLPLWNWHEWGGSPLVAALQGAVFYPPTWLAWLLPLPYSLQLFVFLHIYAAGVGACTLARNCLKLPVPAAICCGVIYMGSDFFPGRIEQFQIIAVNCLLPWLIIDMDRSCRSPNGGYHLPVIWALTLLAGHPQYAVFNLLAALAFTLMSAITPGISSNIAKNWRGYIRVITGLTVGSLAAAVQLLPTWELGQLSERIWPYTDPTQPQLDWKHLPALIFPHYHQFLTGQIGRVFGSTELGLYCGILAVPFAVAGIITGILSNGRTRQTILTVTVLWLLAMIFALGSNAYFATLVFKYLPFFQQSRGAARSLNIASLMLALLAARGIAAFIAAKPLAQNRYKLIGWGLCAVITLDLAFHHFSPLQSVIVRIETLSAKPLVSPVVLQKTSPLNRLYRFMSSDSDLYIDNSPAAVAERIVRMQPNLTSVADIPVIGGYEEGLLPTRTNANLMRRFNRNLRSDAPDAALLAFLGSNIMFTEFPLPEPVTGWKPLSPSFPRPDIVPAIMGQQANYRYWRSSYDMASLVLDANTLVPPSQWPAFAKQLSLKFPISEFTRRPTGQELVAHPLQNPGHEKFNDSIIPPVTQSGLQWNRCSINLTTSTNRLLVLIPPYPGWKLEAKNTDAVQLKSLCSLFYTIESASGIDTRYPLRLVFAPFSLRLGLFLSLISFIVISHGFMQQMLRRRKSHHRETRHK